MKDPIKNQTCGDFLSGVYMKLASSQDGELLIIRIPNVHTLIGLVREHVFAGAMRLPCGSRISVPRTAQVMELMQVCFPFRPVHVVSVVVLWASNAHAYDNHSHDNPSKS